MSLTSISGFTPLSGVSGTSLTQPVHPIHAGIATTAEAAGSADDDAVSVDLSGSPPPEVLEAIAAASDNYDLLAEQGLHVSFGDGESGDGPDLTLQDENGETIASLRPSEVLGLADGLGLTLPAGPTGQTGPTDATTPRPENSDDVDQHDD